MGENIFRQGYVYRLYRMGRFLTLLELRENENFDEARMSSGGENETGGSFYSVGESAQILTARNRSVRDRVLGSR